MSRLLRFLGKRGATRLMLALLLLLGGHLLAVETPAQPTEKERLARAKSMLQMKSTQKQQKAMHILASLKLPEAEKALRGEFDRLDKGRLPLTLWLDLFEAVQASGSPTLQARVAKREKGLEKNPDRLVHFRECLEGGDADAGREIFEKAPEAGCIRCHSINGQGGVIGPELAGLGLRTERIYILESIVLPDESIVMGYSNVLLTLKNGEAVNGLVYNETRDAVTLISLEDGSRRTIKSDDIVSRMPFPSAMPPIFGQALSKRQIRDLVEFIATTEPR